MNPVLKLVLFFPVILVSVAISARQGGKEQSAKTSEDEANASRSTVITSDKLDLLTTKGGHRFLFTGNATVEGTYLRVSCDELEILSRREVNATDPSGKVGRISFIVAKGNVHITQVGRVATADKATIDVPAGIVTMMGSAVLEDDRGKVTGEVIIMERGKRRAEVRGGRGNRPKVELPSLPDLRFGKNKKKPEKKKGKKQKP